MLSQRAETVGAMSGVNIAIGGSLLSAPLAQALAAQEVATGDPTAQMKPGYYPPLRDGLRGSHPGSFEVAHMMRDGKRWDQPSDSIGSPGLSRSK